MNNNNHIFDAPVADVSFDDILSQKANREGLLVYLSPLVNLECSRERYKLVEKLMQFYTGLPDKLKESVVFVGCVCVIYKFFYLKTHILVIRL